ncbi:MAG: segregation/condensation protein A [Patescibacteria group bacterium]
MAFATKQEAFSGPLGLLLELLNKKELEIKDVALASIANDFLEYLESFDVPSEELADFLLIATRLIYLKSRELMPFLEVDEEEEIVSLEDQLRLYRAFVEAADTLQEHFSSPDHLYHRPFKKNVSDEQRIFIAPSNVSQTDLHDSFLSLRKKLEPFFALQEASIERIKSVEERMNELQGAISSRTSISFKDIVNSGKSRPEIVVSFLALLELIRRQVVAARQITGKNDIIIEKIKR